ncbi:MAG: M48 family metalloprotease [Thermoplasmatales archaeon]|nr:M48 family metalloprotease [Thermoplasmatales archaeon]
MGSLSMLKRSANITISLVVGLLLIFMIIVDYVLHFVFQIPFGFVWYSIVIIVALVALFIFTQWRISPAIVRKATGLRENHYISERGNPFLYNMVKRLCERSGIPMPRVAVIDNPSPNAFVFGRNVNDCTLVVHNSLLSKLSKDEIEGVIGHEIGHITHKDVITITLVSAVPLLTYMVARTLFAFLRYSRGGGKGKGKILLFAIIVGVLSYTVYLVSQMLVLRLSRIREYYADAYSAGVTGNPHGLCSALTKIAYGLSLSRKDEPSGVRAFYIGDPVKAVNDYTLLRERMDSYDLDKDGMIDEKELEIAVEKEAKSHWRRANELFSTHPATYRRILMLMEMEKEMKYDKRLKDVYKFI